MEKLVETFLYAASGNVHYIIIIGFILLFVPFFLKDSGHDSTPKSVKSVVHSPTSWLILGLLLLGTYLALGGDLKDFAKSFLHEIAAFLIIAAVVAYALHGQEFVNQFSELLFIKSNYLRNLGRSGKIKFFTETLKSAYKFSDYGIEDEFATLATNSYIPAFEEQYKSNHFIHRTFKPYDSKLGLEGGIRVFEEMGWRTHYPKFRPENMGEDRRAMTFVDNVELYRRLFYDSEISMRKVESFSADADNLNSQELVMCGKTSVSIADRVSEAQFAKLLDEIENCDFDDVDQLSALVQSHFVGPRCKTGLRVDVIPKKRQRIRLNNPVFEFPYEKTIRLNYFNEGWKYAAIEINFFDHTLKIDAGAMLDAIEAKSDYHFVQRAEFYNSYMEPFNVKCYCPTKGIIIDLLFDGLPKNKRLVGTVGFFAHKGVNPMGRATIGRNHYARKFSGWFLPSHGVTFAYRIVDDTHASIPKKNKMRATKK